MSKSGGLFVVTGAASGIGAAVARRWLAAGAQVLAVDVNGGGLQPLKDAGARVVVADLADPDQRSQVIHHARGCTKLVNAAGVIVLKPLLEVTVDDWRHVMAVNAESTFFLCQGIGPTMQPGGAIVNLSSSSAKLASTVEAGAYAASKTTILSITRSFAYQLASIPVRVNSVCPGIIDTPMQDRVLEAVAPLRGLSISDLEAARNDSIPLRRSATPEELAGLIAFLLSGEAAYMTGQAINYTGGLVTW